MLNCWIFEIKCLKMLNRKILIHFLKVCMTFSFSFLHCGSGRDLWLLATDLWSCSGDSTGSLQPAVEFKLEIPALAYRGPMSLCTAREMNALKKCLIWALQRIFLIFTFSQFFPLPFQFYSSFPLFFAHFFLFLLPLDPCPSYPLNLITRTI